MVPGLQVGAYRLVEQIGAGGMGQVWLAEHVTLGRRAAVKLLHPDYSGRSEIVNRFFNEARAATSISDPGIVQIFDFGHHSDGTAYIVMELLEGEGLDKRVRRHGPMAPADALRIIRQVAKSLGAAHARGIVHRDLKPENVYLVRDDEVAGGERAKILDFGIAKLQGDQTGWRTNTSQVMGTPLYMSPEQCRGAGAVDQRSDIYSLGCMLFVLLTGRPPFIAEGAGDLIAMHLREAPPLASQFNVRVTPALDALIARCLAKEPAHRLNNGIELANAISDLLGQPGTLPRANPTSPPPHTGEAATAETVGTTLSSSSGAMASRPVTQPAARRSRGLAIGGAATVVIVGIVAIAATRGGDGKRKRKNADAPAPAPIAALVDAGAVTVPAPDPTPTPVTVTAPTDKRGEMNTRMLQVAAGFLKWSTTHKGAPCPTAKDLAPMSLDDSWGRTMTITCTDQPANQMIGIVSAGPDGVAGNGDDIASWTQTGDVTTTLAGAKWTPKRRAGGGARVGGSTAGGGGVIDLDGDGIPDER